MVFEFKVIHIEQSNNQSLVTVINHNTPKRLFTFKSPSQLKFIVKSVVLFDPEDIIELTVDKETLIITLSHNDKNYGEVKVL